MKKTESVIDELEAEQEVETTKSDGGTCKLARDRKRRAIKLLRIYAEADLILYALTTALEINEDELRTYREVITSKNKLHQQKIMDEKITSLIKNEIWKLIEKPEKKKTTSWKWIF